MPFDIKVSAVMNAAPKTVYDTWLSSSGHTAMTGGKAKQSSKLGAKVTAWGNYISGENLELIPGQRIVQSWRSTQFTADQPDSQIIVELMPAASGTRVSLTHANVPDGESHYEEGWKTHYLDPMQKYFASLAKSAAAKKAPAKKAKPAKKKVKAAKRKASAAKKKKATAKPAKGSQVKRKAKKKKK